MANKELEVKVLVFLNNNDNVKVENIEETSSIRIPMADGHGFVASRMIRKRMKVKTMLIDKTYSGYGHEKIKKLIPYSRQLTASMFDGNGLTTLNFINTIISKEMNHVIDDAAFGRPVKLRTIARLNRLVSKRARIIGDIGHYFGINTLNANEVYAVDTNGIYRHPLAEIAYERLFK